VHAAPGTPARSLIVERPEDDALLLALRLDQTLLSSSISAYQSHGDLLVPLGELCSLLGLGITVDVANGQASGFFVTETRRFELDVVSGRVLVDGKPRTYNAGLVEVHQDDIFVGAGLLSEWLPLKLDVDLYGSVITVHPSEKLPLQLKLEREKKVERSQGAQAAATPHLPRQDLPYRLLDGPFVDQTLRLVRQPAPGGAGRNSLETSTYVTGDLLFTQADLFVSATQNGITDSRLSLGRKDPAGGLFGPLGLREVTAGNVFSPGLDLVTLSRSGFGVLASSFPLQHPTQFDRQDFRGDLPPGWEVELYRGDELLAFAQARPDGLYEFLGVPLLFGMNLFRIELYGPQGQRRTQTQSLNVGQALTLPGKVYYRISASDPSFSPFGGIVSGAGERATAEVSAGLAKHISASASLAAVELEDGRHNYGKLGLRGYWGSLFANVDVAVDARGGSAVQATAQSRLGGFGILVQRTELDSFQSEQFVLGTGRLRSRTNVRVDTAIPESFMPRIHVIADLQQDQIETGGRVTRLSGRLSSFQRGVSVSNDLTWNTTDGVGLAATTTATGRLLVSTMLQRIALRGEVGYNLKPRAGVTEVALTAEHSLPGSLLASAGINRVLLGGQTRFLAGLSKSEGAFGWSATADYSTQVGFGVNLLLSVGLGRDSRSGEWHTQARALAGSGGVSGRVFLDTNGNGVMDAGEQPIAGAGLVLNGATSQARTRADGTSFVPNLTSFQDVDISLASATLEDPYWRSEREGVRVVPRPGKVAIVDLPVVVSGEITGTVYLQQNGRNRGIGNVEVQLVSSQGVVATRATSAFDGYFDLTDVRPGHYTLRVAPEAAVRFASITPPSRTVEMEASGTVVDGLDFVLESLPPQPVSPLTLLAATVPVGAPKDPATPVGSPEAPVPAVARPPSERSLPVPVPALAGRGVAAPDRGSAASFAVQVAAYRDKTGADEDAALVAEKLGRPSRVVRVELSTNGTWYRVLVGAFTSRQEADAFRRKLAAEPGNDVGPVVPLPEAGKAAAQPATPPVRTDTRSDVWAVQLASYRERQGAREDAGAIAKALGMPSHVVEVELGQQGTFYRVFVGSFDSAEGARTFAANLATGGNYDVGPVMRVPAKS
jgi:cell division protein FtsN